MFKIVTIYLIFLLQNDLRANPHESCQATDANNTTFSVSACRRLDYKDLNIKRLQVLPLKVINVIYFEYLDTLKMSKGFTYVYLWYYVKKVTYLN